MKIREAKSEDKEAIIELVRSNWHSNFAETFSYGDCHETCEAFAQSFKNGFEKNKKVLVAEENNKIIGFIIINDFGTSKTWITDIVVDKKYQNKGVGTLLVKKAIEEHPNLYTSINENNKASQALFSKLGFKKVVTSSVWKL